MDRISACRAFRPAPIYNFFLVSQEHDPSLEKICHAFGITLSQLFAEGESPVSLTESQAELMDRWARLDEKQQAVIFQLLDIM